MNEIDLMTEDRLKPVPSSRTRPWPLCHKVCLWWGLAILAQIIAIALHGAALLDRPAEHGPATPAPSPSSSSTWSPECTAEDLEDGACYTWDDIRDLEWHSEAP